MKQIKKKKTKVNSSGSIPPLANFVYEIGILASTPRSGLWFLGTGQQSVAEHLLRTAYITYALSHYTSGIDKYKAVMMALTHDLGEGRTSDHNYVHQKYGRLAESEALADLARTVSFGDDLVSWHAEEQSRLTPEAMLVKDADQLEWIATLRTEEVKGNKKARVWADIAYKRLKTKPGKQLGKELIKTNPDEWWFNAKDKWWVDRKQEKKGSTPKA